MALRLTVLSLLVARASASDDVVMQVPLRAPMTTIVYAPLPITGQTQQLDVEVDVPIEAATPIGASIFVLDDGGQWFQNPSPLSVPAGHRVRLHADLDHADSWRSEPGITTLSPARRSLLRRYGVFLWSQLPSRAVVSLHFLPPLASEVATAPSASTSRLEDVAMPGLDGNGHPHVHTGDRFTLSLRPQPFPQDPYDPDAFSLALEIDGPGGPAVQIFGFYDLPMSLSDRGDCEVSQVSGADRFLIRYRPRLPGRYSMHLVASWNHGEPLRIALPDLVVDGEAWDGYVHVDAQDPRFFCLGSSQPAFIWPIGLNLASPCDQLTEQDISKRAYLTHPTPDRGTFSYDAFLGRLSAAGGTAAEIWMSSWNLGLEWNRKWQGYHNIGFYNERNAARMDRLLDCAYAKDIRLVVNLNNHGQYLANSGESEWLTNPYNRINGGPLGNPEEVFTNPQAIASQDHLRRYIAARYADHPAILIWKLFSEVDLTQLGIRSIRAGGGGMDLLRAWHEHAADDWHRLDIYHHPVATHVATTYQNADPGLFSSPALDAVGLDAYFAPRVYTHADNLSGLMVDTMLDPYRGTLALHKPVFVTEYGGGFHNMNHDELGIEHRSGAWLALVTGQATSPMLWMHEWVDQNNQWLPYHAISLFMAGEDLRHADACSVTLSTQGPRTLWAQAWTRPGAVLAYIQDAQWAHSYAPQPDIVDGVLIIGAEVAAGTMRAQWWNADTGGVMADTAFHHVGGALALQIPSFSCHIALKLKRIP